MSALYPIPSTGLVLGQGYDRVTRVAKQNRAVRGAAETSFGETYFKSNYKICATFEELIENIENNESAKFSGVMGGGVGGSASFKHSLKRSEYQLIVLIWADVKTLSVNLLDPIPTVDNFTSQNDLKNFLNDFGDSFVSGIAFGGTYIAVMSYSFLSSEEYQSSTQELNANGIQLGSVGKIDAGKAESANRILSKYSINVSVSQIASGLSEGVALPSFEISPNDAVIFAQKFNTSLRKQDYSIGDKNISILGDVVSFSLTRYSDIRKFDESHFPNVEKNVSASIFLHKRRDELKSLESNIEFAFDIYNTWEARTRVSTWGVRTRGRFPNVELLYKLQPELASSLEAIDKELNAYAEDKNYVLNSSAIKLMPSGNIRIRIAEPIVSSYGFWTPSFQRNHRDIIREKLFMSRKTFLGFRYGAKHLRCVSTLYTPQDTDSKSIEYSEGSNIISLFSNNRRSIVEDRYGKFGGNELWGNWVLQIPPHEYIIYAYIEMKSYVNNSKVISYLKLGLSDGNMRRDPVNPIAHTHISRIFECGLPGTEYTPNGIPLKVTEKYEWSATEGYFLLDIAYAAGDDLHGISFREVKFMDPVWEVK